MKSYVHAIGETANEAQISALVASTWSEHSEFAIRWLSLKSVAAQYLLLVRSARRSLNLFVGFSV